MTIRYVSKLDHGLIVEVWAGVVTRDEWQEHLVRMFNDPNFRLTQRQIADMRFSSADPAFGESEIAEVVSALGPYRELLRGRKVALVALEEFEKVKFFERLMHHQPFTTIVFSDINTACTWLGIDPIETEREIWRIRDAMKSSPHDGA